MDSYEAFINEYCDFLEKYSEEGEPVSMMEDYVSYMEKYGEVIDHLLAMEDNEDNLTSAELAYYMEVNARIMQRMAEVE